MDLSEEHYDLLQAVSDLQAGDEKTYVSTEDVGPRYREVLEARRGSGMWFSMNPWYGTNPEAGQLMNAGLLQVLGHAAKFRAPGQPPEQEPIRSHLVALTNEGRRRLAERQV